MVGQYIIEDEYTINVRVKRDANSPHANPPLLTLSCSDPSDEYAHAELSEFASNPSEAKLFTLKYRQSDPLIGERWEAASRNTALRGSSQPPVLTLVPHPNAHIKSVDATYIVNGIPEKSNLFVHESSIKGNMVQEIICEETQSFMHELQRISPKDYYNFHHENLKILNDKYSKSESKTQLYKFNSPVERKQSSVKMLVIPTEERSSPKLKPISGFSFEDRQGRQTDNLNPLKTVSSFGNVSPLKPVKGFDYPTNASDQHLKFIHDQQLRFQEPLTNKKDSDLPSVKVYDDTNTLVSKNAYSTPNYCKKDSQKSPEQTPIRPASIFVKPIKRHCATGSGELYVAPVNESAIFASKKLSTVALKGNSRRRKERNNSNFREDDKCSKGDCVSGIYPNSGPTILTSGGNDPGDVSSPSSVNSNFFKSGYLSNKNEIMLVTNEPVSSPHLGLPCPLFSANNNILSPNINGTHPRAAKYFIDDSQPHMLEGCENHDSIYGQDNPGFDPSFNFMPFGDLRSLDPGYGSERSENDAEEDDMGDEEEEEDEKSYSSSDEYSPNPRHSFFEPPQGIRLDVEYLMKIFPFINEGTLFEVTIFKNSRGLGLALTGGIECETGVLPGLIRIRTIYPQTPAWLCGQLQVNDFILEANGNQLTGLTSHEALEMLRIAGSGVNLIVCRAPPEVLSGKEDMSPTDTPDRGVVSTSLSSSQPITGNHLLSPSPTSFSLCGEFEIVMIKVSGSLGFTLRKNDNSILGHTIRSLVKEPALSDGRLRPGDKLLSVNGTDMCGLSHEEAVHFLRTCPETVIIRIYRDAIQTPVSPASPTEPEFSKPKPLRKEARDMLSDLASRKHSSPNPLGDNLDVSTTRRRRLKNCTPESKAERWESLVRKAEEVANNSSNRDISPFDNSHSDTLTAASSRSGTVVSRSSSSEISFKDISRPSSPTILSMPPSLESRPRRPDFLDLNSSYSSKKSQFTPPHEDPCMLPSPNVTQFNSLDSAPHLTSTHSDTPAFTHLQSCYRSVNVSSSPFTEKRLINTTSDHNISNHDDNTSKENALLKWKGVVFTPEDEKDGESSFHDLETSFSDQDSQVLTIELVRGWNSRLGFSLQNSADGKSTEIVVIYSDSLAARDGRLKVGDIIQEVNGHDVRFWDAQDVIDLLRKTRGKIILKVLQK